MHQRNKYYNNAPDFIKLAVTYPSLKKYIKFNRHSKTGTINFKDPRACRELTYALLWCDFKIRLEIPLDSLCPIIPGRLDYIHWIEDLVVNNLTYININNNDNENSNIYGVDNCVKDINVDFYNNEIKNLNSYIIKGIDIGTGASCIYPLLACRLHPSWKMEALELNERSYEYAKNNVERNDMKNQIKVRKVKNEKNNIFSILSKKVKKNKIKILFQDKNSFILQYKNKINYNKLLKLLASPDYDFCMCNPPFYSSEFEMEQCKDLKIEEPHSICTGSLNEMLTNGGEVQFISNIINDSIQQYKLKKKSIKKFCKLIISTNNSNLLNERLFNKKSLLKKGLTIKWYTSLIGKKSSIEPLVNYLKSKKYIKEIKTTSFKQGKTVRWGIAWSFKAINYPSFN